VYPFACNAAFPVGAKTKMNPSLSVFRLKRSVASVIRQSIKKDLPIFVKKFY
jgi:hypothetical protein